MTKPMKMITLFLPEKYLELLDALVSSNMYPNRSEALRMAAWKFIQDNVALLRAINLSSAKDAVLDSIKDASPASVSTKDVLAEIGAATKMTTTTTNATPATPPAARPKPKRKHAKENEIASESKSEIEDDLHEPDGLSPPGTGAGPDDDMDAEALEAEFAEILGIAR